MCVCVCGLKEGVVDELAYVRFTVSVCVNFETSKPGCKCSSTADQK